MKAVTKLDWAERKARKLSKTWGGVNGSLAEQVTKLLRAERRRAVRVCKQQRGKCSSTWTMERKGYNDGCTDCARAIGGQ